MAAQYLATERRRRLEKTIREAREVAEDGAGDALRRLGVADPAAPPYLDEAQKKLRRRLRAHARSLGDPLAQDRQETTRLIGAAAYAHWHRMLFARFLAERGLLRHPEHDVAVSLEDCRELAAEEGLADGWTMAERYAAAMLPAVFQPDNPVLALPFAPEHAQRLQSLVAGLDAAVFAADDSLGWTYQFWRAVEKDAVNKSGVKIGADELPAVTQLFTEPYMVRFLLHNTLGAWWAGKVLAGNPDLAKTAPDEAALREACGLPGYGWEMLRFVQEEQEAGSAGGATGKEKFWRPAAGTFPGWPNRAAEITVLDPCCGSGHFLTEALAILAALRQEEEELQPDAAVAATLRDNLHGLEIDERCVQIAAFAVALTAWRIGGWQTLPLPHVAWVGAPPPLPRKDFVSLANGDADLGRALGALHDLFARAPLLGSLIETRGGDLADPRRLERIESLLDQFVEKVRAAEPERVEGAIAARGMADAAALLARRYTLQATNVPFLGRSKQSGEIAAYLERHYPEEKSDLANALMMRLMKMCIDGGDIAVVVPQNWLFIRSFEKSRKNILKNVFWRAFIKLGPAAFRDMNWWAANTAMVILAQSKPLRNSLSLAVNVSSTKLIHEKEVLLRSVTFRHIHQFSQLKNPGARITDRETNPSDFLASFAISQQGITTGDQAKYGRNFWELLSLRDWRFWQGTVQQTARYSGRESVLYWKNDGSLVKSDSGATLRGSDTWDEPGVLVSSMNKLLVTISNGYIHDDNTAKIIPLNQNDIEALWAFCASEDFYLAVREVDQAVKVMPRSFLAIEFGADRWRAASHSKPASPSQPYSDDPTQWLFHGHPGQAEKGTALLVALARLAGYRWPAESDSKMRLSTEARAWIAKAATLPAADNDGLLCLPAVAGERPLAERLRAYLAAAFGSDWSDTLECRMVAEADERFDKRAARDGSLEAWLRDRAFRQHCKLFHDRPFLWQVWDGLKDGFSVFVHYHRLDQATLRKLTFTLLNDWLARAKVEKKDLRVEKARVLQQSLEAILDGEDPYDIFVRWKPLARQPLGWDPDLDDGVRMNIRPFMTADILRDQPNIRWTKDRGSDVKSAPWYSVFGGERINDYHTTLAEKQAARAATAKSGEAAE